MPCETGLPLPSPMIVHTEQVHHMPLGQPPTPTPAPQLSLNSLELHIPIPIPTPPTPLPIVIAYPLSTGPVTPAAEHAPLGPVPHSKWDMMQTYDSGVELEPVPAPVQARRLGAGHSADSEETLHDPLEPEPDYELINMTEQERVDAQTVYLFRALNVPLNIHRLRVMRLKGRLPAPLLKFKHGSTRSKHARSLSTPGKENKNMHLTSILRIPGLNCGSHEDPNQESPTEMETVEGESWYLPSATACRMTRQRSRFDDEHLEQQDRRNWESPYPTPRELRMEDLPAPQPIIPNQALLDQFPLPPSSLPSVASQPESCRIPLPPTPSPAPIPSLAPSPSGRPLGYMYASPKPLRRTPSCKSCGGGSPAPGSSASSSRTLTPALPVPPREGVGCYYAYGLLTPSPGALPYSGYASVRSVSPNYPVSFAASPIPPH
ncbi:hypothetical protein ACEPAI_4702 [Sanghuangporus weigelae]